MANKEGSWCIFMYSLETFFSRLDAHSQGESSQHDNTSNNADSLSNLINEAQRN
eukprot:m.605445 g.605445  ORF g.605445 m.605445 type:complete len:54 (+) comp58110_c0_seq8:1315-1476(+)